MESKGKDRKSENVDETDVAAGETVAAVQTSVGVTSEVLTDGDVKHMGGPVGLGLAVVADTSVNMVPTTLPTGGGAWLRPHVARPEELGYVPGAVEAEAKRERARARREAKQVSVSRCSLSLSLSLLFIPYLNQSIETQATEPRSTVPLAATKTKVKIIRRPVFVYVERLEVGDTDEDFDDFGGEYVVEECAEPFSRPLPVEVEDFEVYDEKYGGKGKDRKGKYSKKKGGGKWSDGAFAFLPKNGGWLSGEQEETAATSKRKRKRGNSEPEPEETAQQKRERVDAFESAAETVSSNIGWMQVAGGLFGGGTADDM